MSHALHDLLNLLKPKKLEDGLFRGQSEDLGLQHVFGGQVLGQALYAARDTIPADRMIHSLHSYFLRPGDIEKAIIYSVETLRDGQSFSARRISALQDDQPIFTMTASFQAAENGFEHQKAMPQVRGPENLPAESEIARQLSHFIPEKSKGILLSEKPFEIRPVTFHNPLKGHVDDPLRHVWLRLNGTLSEETGTGQSLLAYASDYNFLPVALQPHGKGFLEPGIQIATVDHSIWFHRPFDLNQWLLYSMESTSASGARGFVRGEFYSQDGTLVASTAQEGVIRVRP